MCVKFGVSRSNSSRDIRLPQFVTDDDEQTTADAGRDKANTLFGVLPQNCQILL